MTKILIVDDSSFARKRLKIIFERAGHEVVGSAEDGEQALSLFDELHPDVVTLDYLMAGQNGEEILQEMIRHDPDARVVIVSGSGDHTIKDRLLSCGAKLFVEKLSGHAAFLRAVDQVMKD